MMKNHLKVFCVFIVVIITAIAFIPSLFNEFIMSWDDDRYVVENDTIKSVSIQNLKKIFSGEYHHGGYLPLTMLSYMVEYRFFKLNPFIYHLSNYLLHILITLCVFYFIYFLSQNLNIAFITAILFGIHPLHVESVAWISERKDLLCAIFYVLALIAYCTYLRSKKIAYYFLCFLCAFLSLLSKSMAVTLPVVVVLLDYVHGRKMNKRAIFEKLPFFALSLIIGSVNFYFFKLVKVTELMANLDVKIYFASKVILFYLSKVFIPTNLSAIYSYHHVIPEHLANVKYYIAILILLFLSVVFSRRYSKRIVFGSGFFIVTILPVLKLIPAGIAFAADRYMYLPSIGIFFIFAVFFERIFRSEITKIKIMKFSIVFLLFLGIIQLSVLTWERCKVWKNTKTLFMDVTRTQATSAVAYMALGEFFVEKGDFDQAARCYKKALMIEPESEAVKGALTSVYQLMGTKKTRKDIKRIQMKSKEDIAIEVESLNKLGVAQGKSRNFDAAISLFKEAIELAPNHAESYNYLGFTYYLKGDLRKAEEYFKKTLKIDPNHEKARMNLRRIQGN